MKKIYVITFFILGSVLSFPTHSQDYSFEEIKIWGDDTPPLNKDHIKLEEKTDAEGKRYSQISNPVLWLYKNTNRTKPGPAIIYFPGGGYSKVSVKNKGERTAKVFFEMGFSAVAILKYRLPDGRIVNEKEKVPLFDAQKALSLLHKNANSWHIDRTKIGVIGASAGGHLAASLNNLTDQIIAPGVQPEELIQAFSILRASVISFTPELTENVSSHKKLLKGKLSNEELINFYSMEKQVNSKTPPTFMVYSTDDDSVPYQNSVVYANKLKENNIPNKTVELSRGGHGFGYNLRKVDKDWITILDEWLHTIMNFDYTSNNDPVVSTLPVYERFNYKIGKQLIGENETKGLGLWSASSSKSKCCDVFVTKSPNWTIPNISTPKGNAIEFGGNGVKPELLFTSQKGNFGKLYASVLIKITDASTLNKSPSRFLGFGRLNSKGSVSGATHIFVRSDGNGGYNLGVNQSNSSSGVVWDKTNYSTNNGGQDLMLVIYYDDGNSNANTTAKLWINPKLNGTEPSATIVGTKKRNISVDRIQIYQHSSSNTPKMFMDELRIGKSWKSVTK